MVRFNPKALPDKTKNMHETQRSWRGKNWRKSLKEHHNGIEEILSLLELFDFWKNRLTRDELTKYLSREIYSDGYLSVHFSCFGLYKYAYMSLRSEFETTLRLIYFSSHQLEFSWWQEGDEKWIRDLLKGTDVWGQNFKYFGYIPEMKIFEESCEQDKGFLKGNKPRLRETYSKLSKHVHSIAPYLQTKHGLSPKYKQDEFQLWYEIFKEVQRYINILLVLCFCEKFKKMTDREKNSILDLAIGNEYKDLVKLACGL